MATAARGRRLSADDRRREIVEATLATVAAVGYRGATFARIAERGALSSTRLISYHFSGREELMGAVIAHVYSDLRAHVGAATAAAATPPEELAAYLRGVVGFVDGHRDAMIALSRIFVGFRDEAGHSRSYDADTDRRAIGVVEGILQRGQEQGLFRRCDTFVLGSAVQRSVDGLPFLLETRPDLDLDAYAEELVTAFDLATRAAPARDGPWHDRPP